MRSYKFLLGIACALSYGASCTVARGADEPPLQTEPYNKHHDRHFGHDRLYPDRGSIFRDVPHGASLVNYAGLTYRFYNGIWFEQRGPAFIVVMPPIGLVVPALPEFVTGFKSGDETYYYANDVYYLSRPDLGGYEVVNDPVDMEPTPSQAGATRGVSGAASGSTLAVAAAPAAAVAGTASLAGGAAAGGSSSVAGLAPATKTELDAKATPGTVAAPAVGAVATTGAGAGSIQTIRGTSVASSTLGATAGQGSSSAASAAKAVPVIRTASAVGGTSGVTAVSNSIPAAVPAVMIGPPLPASRAASSNAAGSTPSSPPTPATPSAGTATPAQAPTSAALAAPALAGASLATPAPKSAATPPAPEQSATSQPAIPASHEWSTQETAAAAPATAPPATTALSSGMPGSTHVSAYGRNGQSLDQQARDQYDCYRFGVAQSGYDPMTHSGAAASGPAQAEFDRARTACFEARGYALH